MRPRTAAVVWGAPVLTLVAGFAVGRVLPAPIPAPPPTQAQEIAIVVENPVGAARQVDAQVSVIDLPFDPAWRQEPPSQQHILQVGRIPTVSVAAGGQGLLRVQNLPNPWRTTVVRITYSQPL